MKLKKKESTGSHHWDRHLEKFNLSNEVIGVIRQLRIDDTDGIIVELLKFIDSENKKLKEGLLLRLRGTK